MHLRTLGYVLTTILAVTPSLANAAAARSERLACQTGTEDEHARIAMDVTKGKVQRFAYYSKWKPKTCSIAATRGDAYTKWSDKGNVTTVILPKGTATIEQEKGGVYRVTFKNADRELYCGLEGEINGTVTVTHGKHECGLEGVMERPESLQQDKPPKEEGAAAQK
jgi:hypothetical protein